MNLKFTVFGKPAQMGSKRAFVRAGRAVMVNDNSDRQRQWYTAVASRAAEEMGTCDLLTGPLIVTLRFALARPKGHFGSGKNAGKLKVSAPQHHAQKPDIDKLTRNTLDAMTGVIWRDDAQVCELHVHRSWTEGQQGATIEIQELDA